MLPRPHVLCYDKHGFIPWSQSTRLSREGALGPLSFISERQYIEQSTDNQQDQSAVNRTELQHYTIELVLFGYLIPFAYHFVRASYMGKAASPAVGIPMWIVQSITVISFGLCEIRLLQKLISRIGMIRRGEKEKKGEE